MYRILLLLVIIISGKMTNGQNKYDIEWKKVAELDKKGLPRQALDVVKNIFIMAVADKNDPQQIKSTIYQFKYRTNIEEDSDQLNLQFLDSLFLTATVPSKMILHSIRADIFWNYIQMNRYRLYQRTALEQEDGGDITTWSLEKLHQKIAEDYLASLQHKKLLQSIPINEYDDILVKGKNTRHLRPTLYDFLAHRALEYFVSSEREITQPAYQFRITDEDAFGNVNLFSKKSFATSDTQSLNYRALNIYQDLIAFHLDKNNIEALVDVDLARLEFVKNNGVFANTNALYEEALKQMEKRYSPHRVTAHIMMARATLYRDQGQEAGASDTMALAYAADLSREVMKQYPSTEAAKAAHNLLLSIEQPSLTVKSEIVNLPNKPIKLYVQYKNVKKVFFRIVPVENDYLMNNRNHGEAELLKRMLRLKPVSTFSQNFPEETDYRNHAAEVYAGALSGGTYLLLSSLKDDFTTHQNIITYHQFYISDLALVGDPNQAHFVVHRETGKPLPNVTAVAYERRYKSANRQYDWEEFARYTTDVNGSFLPKEEKGYRSLVYELIYGRDRLFINDIYFYGYYNDFEPKKEEKLFLFTDRSLYRPGQELFFKGILFQREKDGARSEVLAGKPVTLSLRDRNNIEHGKASFTTNKFGSFHGSFRLPEGALNGTFTLRDSLNRVYLTVNVEEYKRPKFKVEISKPLQAYRLGDSITVKGTAMAYAGYPVANAKVTYRVKRQTSVPYWLYRHYRIWPPYPQTAMEVDYGTVVTDEAGQFTLTFAAIPDEQIDKKLQPVFHFQISADVTDEAGETRSAGINVPASYQAIQLTLSDEDNLHPDSLASIKIHSKNMSGDDEKVPVVITVSSLNGNDKIYRKRYWEMPDRFVMTREQHDEWFPHDEYRDESDPQTWPVKQVVLQKNDTTSPNGSWLKEVKTLLPGWYKMEVSATDRFGEKVTAQQIFQVTAPQDAGGEPLLLVTDQEKLQPGDLLKFDFRTSFDHIWLIHQRKEMQSDQKAEVHEIVTGKPLNRTVQIREKDRGGLAVGYVFVKHNRMYAGQNSFSVPWENKMLDVSLKTFRDELLPGKEETWSLTIKGPKGDALAAEALVSMYDASLDQFKAHDWNKLSTIWPGLSKFFQWKGIGFDDRTAESSLFSFGTWKELEGRSYDRLINFERRSLIDRTLANYDLAGNLEEVVVAGISKSNKRESRSKVAAGGLMPESEAADASQSADTIAAPKNEEPVRTNLNETAFFFPDLQTDDSGNIHFTFTTPEALTQWRLMVNAHTPGLLSGYLEQKVITRKPLMVQPNMPRFFREGDRLELPAQIVNTSDKEIKGTVQLELIDAITGKSVDGWFKNALPRQHFSVEAGKSQTIFFPVEVPFSFNSALLYRVVAAADDAQFSDGEQAAVPVLSNRLLVTETFPLTLINETEKTFRWDKLLNASTNGSLTHQSVTVEFSTNPVWYAIQSLPYLMEYPYECSEQTFNRYYANNIAAFMMNKIPNMKQILDQWTTKDTAALLSNLQKNQELKSVLLEETPWVLAAKTEAEQKANLTVLFNMKRLAEEGQRTLNKVKELQLGNGGFSWFKGGPDDRYITQYIVAGAGRLMQIQSGVQPSAQLTEMVEKAIPYIDARMLEDYNRWMKDRGTRDSYYLTSTIVHYLYARSFFPKIKMNQQAQKAHDYFLDQAGKHGLEQSRYAQAMIAITLHRYQQTSKASAILASLKDNAIRHPELGMYWKEVATRGFYWHQASIEAHAMIMAAFAEITPAAGEINEMKTWLLRNKQTNSWESTRATADAIYALLFSGSDWKTESRQASIQLGNRTWAPQESEAGTGYSKTVIPGEEVQNGMGNIHVKLSSGEQGSGLSSWGSVYWQYFENMDKITPGAGGMKLSRKFFREVLTDRGPVLQEISEGETLQIGNKLVMRVHIQTDRDMEYIHLKDMRPAGTEPVNVLSGYRYQGGLGYYQSTRDASTDFFFHWLPRGSHILEYPVFVTHAGEFSTGISTIQSMYAPEFSAHSGGERLPVAPK